MEHVLIDLQDNKVAIQAEELRVLVQTLIDIMDSVGTVDVRKVHKIYISTFIRKIIYHSLSLNHLSKGSILNTKQTDVVIIDASTCFILTRALIETYITFNYIYIQPKTEEEQFFRFKLWEISGFIPRQTLTPLHGTTYKEREKVVVDKLKIALESDPFYENLNKDQKKRLKKYGLPRILGWKELIKECGFDDKIVNGYSHFSQYAHSDYFAMLQIKYDNYRIDVFDRPDRQDINLCLRLAQVFISKSINDVVDLIPECKKAYDKLPILIAAKIKFLSTLHSK